MVKLSEIQQGEGNEIAPLYDDVIASDTVPVPEILLQRGNYLPQKTQIPFDRYLDPGYARLEQEHVWKKCWQFACREEEIPNTGDCMPYDVGPLSFIIVRTGENSFGAYYNSCSHRGTRLVHRKSHVSEIRCRFHGWCWSLDGKVKEIPGRWDFEQYDLENLHLAPVSIDSWGGCLFINPDPDCGPLSDALGIIPEHFAHVGMENRFTFRYFRKKLRCNWKVLWEGFLEAYHVMQTHAQGAEYLGDINSRYDIFDDGTTKIGRFMAAMGVPSPITGTVSRRDSAIMVMEQLFSTIDNMDQEIPDYSEVEDFGRKDVAAWKREFYKSAYGVDLSHFSDAEMLDGIQYDMFPNFAPWLGEGFAVMYQFLPYGTDPNESVFCVRMTMPVPEGQPRPPAAEPVEMDFDTEFSEFPEWGAMNEVYEQDVATLPMVQRGMRSAHQGRAHTNLGIYQEQRCAMLHEFIEEKIREGSST